MTTRLFIDFETRSSTDLRKSNVYRYTEDPTFDPLLLLVAKDDDPVQAIEDPARIARYLQRLAAKYPKAVWVAHNAGFDRIVAQAVGTTIPPERWTDTMAIANELGMPASLGYLAKFVGAEEKDTAGTQLINLFSKPRRDGSFVQPTDQPEKWADFVRYGVQDVETMRDIVRRWDEEHDHDTLAWWRSTHEFRVWCADQHINDRGILLDHQLATAAVAAAGDNQAAQRERITEISGVNNPGSVQQLTAWLETRGVPVDNLRKETVEMLLAAEDLDSDVREVLELRQELALVAYKKFIAALAHESADHRLRGQFRFFGAHTGRWTGSGVQLHNLARAGFKLEEEAEAAILDLKMGLGADAQTLKMLVRPMMLGPLVVADYSAIEARVLAWLAGEEWALEAFRLGRDLYVETAARMGSHYDRRDGKVAVLALGYNGGVGSLEAMGATGSRKALQQIVLSWREANLHIVAFWQKLERAFRKGGDAGPVQVLVKGHDRHVVLPSGRVLIYYNVRTKMVTDPETGASRPRTTFLDPRYGRVDTYGGRLAENVTQAVARDVLAHALVNLTDYGYAVVGHVHDEVLIEVDKADPAYLAPVVKIMCDNPRWAAGLPLNAAGFVTERYRKD